MAILEEVYTLSKTYPVITVIIAIILFGIGFKITTKLFKWILWIISALAVIVAIVLLFFFN